MDSSNVDGAIRGPQDSAWATAWVVGEMADATTWEKITRYLASLKDPNNAKVFQGTVIGKPAIYVVHRQ